MTSLFSGSSTGPSAGDPFVHLHVASGYSLQYGASLPGVLVERAAEAGMDTLALTDRDGVYGAVKFAKACAGAGIRPVFGADLAVEPSGLLPAPMRRTRTPVRGGASVDPRHPRVTVLARDGRGWAALCRLLSATHLRGERGTPVTSLELLAEHAASGRLFLLLGPDSEVGRALALRRPDLARAVLSQWRAATEGGESLRLEAVSFRGPDDNARAARMLGLADEERLGAVLTNAVRYADRTGAPIADVLDAARRLVALDLRHVDRTTAEGYLKTGKEMQRVAEDVTRMAGLGQAAARRLLAATRAVADFCAVDPAADLGLGGVHFPELAVLDSSGRAAEVVLRERCEAGIGRRGLLATGELRQRLDAELGVISTLGYPSYFLTVADVVDLIRDMGVRVAARGSGAGSLVNYLLGISGVDPMRHGLLMERFLSPLRRALPDIDLDVESARRMEVYERILERFGAERTTCVSMMDTYRVRHAIRDVGAALGLPPGEIDTLAKAFPHIRARDARTALAQLPELRASGIATSQTDLLFSLVERLDGLPRHIALHPCGVLLSDATLLDRTPVEASWLGFPMSQFDKDDVEDLGLLKLDVLGIRMQSAMSHAVREVERVDGEKIDLDAVPLDDPDTFALVQSTRTLGCFQIESPGQRELVGKFGPQTFADLIIDISLFRPGPVQSDMVTPFLQARQGWKPARYPHEDLRPALEQTAGVVVFHEQVLQILAVTTGCTLAEADEARRGLGDRIFQPEVEAWFRPLALARGYEPVLVDEIWEVLRAFGSFGFCKAHAAAFALPTYQSAWLKAHHPAAFFAGILTADPGMYPKRLILDDARQFGIAVLPLDVNASAGEYLVERLGDSAAPGCLGVAGDAVLLDMPPTTVSADGALPPENNAAAMPYGIRLGLSDVKGITDAEVVRIVAGHPYVSLADFWARAAVSRPVVERLILTGAFDSVHGIGLARGNGRSAGSRRAQLTRRDLLLQLSGLDAQSKAESRAQRSLAARSRPIAARGASGDNCDVRSAAARQGQGPRLVAPVDVQLPLFADPVDDAASGLPEMTGAERVRAELEVLGLDASSHVLDFYEPFFAAVGVTRARDLLGCRSEAEVLVAGVKVATQTPPIRSGKRIIFVTLDDATGPLDATFFEDAQIGYATTLFHSWLLLIRGVLRRTGPRGVSLRATGCWELPAVADCWQQGGVAAVTELLAADAAVLSEAAVAGAAASRASRPVLVRPPTGSSASVYEPREGSTGSGAGGMTPAGGLRGHFGDSPAGTGLAGTGPAGTGPAGTGSAGTGPAAGFGEPVVHPTGFVQDPYTDVAPAGTDARAAPRKLWHSSSGSAGS